LTELAAANESIAEGACRVRIRKAYLYRGQGHRQAGCALFSSAGVDVSKQPVSDQQRNGRGGDLEALVALDT
jgi:hypothetical protein